MFYCLSQLNLFIAIHSIILWAELICCICMDSFFVSFFLVHRSHRMEFRRQSVKECCYAFNVSRKFSYLVSTMHNSHVFYQIVQHFMNFNMEFNCSSVTFPWTLFHCMWIWYYLIVPYTVSPFYLEMWQCVGILAVF